MNIKKRIIPNLKVINDVVYTTKQFMPYRVAGETYSVFDYFYHTQADEVVICDISEKKNFPKFLLLALVMWDFLCLCSSPVLGFWFLGSTSINEKSIRSMRVRLI